MPSIRLYGTLTSPYVRRVRIIASELSLAHEFVDTATEQGQAALRQVNPLWKVPAAQIDGTPVFDSRVISELLMRNHGPGPLRPLDSGDMATANVITVIDGVLDALINTFYLGKDNVTADQSSYMSKHHARAAASMAWLDAQIGDGSIGGSAGFGLAEIAVCTAAEWMMFRGTYPVDQHPAVAQLVAHHASRPSMVQTSPPQ